MIAKSIKDTITGTAKDQTNKVKETSSGGIKDQTDKVKETDPLFHAKVTPMGEEKTPLSRPDQEMNEETKNLQKKGAQRKQEEDSFNLM